MAVLSVVELAENSRGPAQTTECTSTMYGASPPSLIVANDSEILNNLRPLLAGVEMES